MITIFKMLSGPAAPLLLLFHLVVVTGCTRQGKLQAEKYRETRMLMGTIVHLDVCRSGRNTDEMESAYRDVWSRLEDISWRMNVIDQRSDVARINNAGLEPVEIGADTYEVLQTAIDVSRATGGAFDITIWPLMKLWRESEKNNVMPGSERIKDIQTAVGSHNIQLLENNRVRLLNKDTKIDLGGIAKGYALDEAARIFREHGITGFFIDAGGDIYVGGQNCSGGPWRIGIRDPRDKSRIIEVVAVTDAAVTTSGDYEQYYVIQNEQWSHIINPVTGYPQKRVISATVIAPQAVEADALATALSVLGGDLGTGYVNAMEGPYASLIIVQQGTDRIKNFTSRKYNSYRSHP